MENLPKNLSVVINHPLVEDVLKTLPPLYPNITLGLSGGLDSVVLLHILAQISKERSIQLSAIHINHGLSPNADYWSKFCEDLCVSLDIKLINKKIKLERLGGESLEDVARKARYFEFGNTDAEIIALAHHQDDQVETILSQLFRGSNLHNIAAMRLLTKKGNKMFWRPLLSTSRNQIEEYAKEFKLQFITDESNEDSKFLRNFIRHKIMPLLNNWDNNIKTKLLNFNQQLQDLLHISDGVARMDLEHSLINDKIELDKFKLLDHLRQVNLLTQFIKRSFLPLPSNRQLNEFISQALTSSFDKKPQLKLNDDYLIVKYKKQIFIEKHS